MSFVPICNLEQVKSFTSTPKFGTIVSNKDPKMLGRVKVNIPGLFEGEEGYLPWIRRKMDTVFCGLNCEIFDVPEVGSIVQVQWDYDTESPTYSGTPYNQKHQTNTFTENYPFEAGIKFGDCVIKFDKAAKYIRIYNPSAEVIVDGTGLIHLIGKRMQLETTDLLVDADNTVFTGNVSICGDFSSTVGACGIIGMNSIASVANGLIQGVSQ